MSHIDQVLQENPSKIARAAEEAEKLRLEWLTAEEEYKNYEAMFLLKEKAESERMTATELKLRGLANHDLYQKRLDNIVRESNYRSKEIEVKTLENEFNGCKMQARIKIAELSNIDFNERGK